MDPVHFTGMEIIEMAVRIEENGLKYYTDAGKAAKRKELKDLFLKLADEERQHIELFMDLKKNLGGEPETGFDPYIEDAKLYLRAIADTEVFTNPDKGRELAKKVTDEKDAIRVAIDMEKDSLLFYYEMQRMIRERERHILDNIIFQEKDHVRKLTDLNRGLFGRS